ncbi:hypothetical protein TIFTF001_015700 [Ficus carica]|uniref:Uncharacterized protein n=1 Tax=Ficus carica TaxID=3494 RepID=A0AA88A8U4_FICCA|nr:hypothetical protein TIFTF001_015700 [Ficus carica]
MVPSSPATSIGGALIGVLATVGFSASVLQRPTPATATGGSPTNTSEFPPWPSKRLAASTMSKRNAIAPSNETTRAAAAWSQNLSKVLHTFFHCTCEFPSKPSKPMAAAAPLAEKSSPMITASMMTIRSPEMLFPSRFANERTRENAAYEHATAFATTKYLSRIDLVHNELLLINS